MPSLTKSWRVYRLAAASTLDLEASRLKPGRLSNSGTSTRGLRNQEQEIVPVWVRGKGQRKEEQRCARVSLPRTPSSVWVPTALYFQSPKCWS